jgi:hypothetical protein
MCRSRCGKLPGIGNDGGDGLKSSDPSNPSPVVAHHDNLISTYYTQKAKAGHAP